MAASASCLRDQSSVAWLARFRFVFAMLAPLLTAEAADTCIPTDLVPLL
jgi:hypothetical protein